MLVSLGIQNFILIDSLEVQFDNGFTVITGETGSGKSILLGALQLILGERADYSVMRDKEKKTVVEAVFRLKEFHLKPFFDEFELDYLDETIIRREITSQGKSRAFINDSPVSLSVLKGLSERLIHIHSQHHTIQLRSHDFQLDIIDALADAFILRKEFKDALFSLNKLKSLLEDKELIKDKFLLEADYNQFQLQEFDLLQFDKTDFEELEKEFKQLDSIDEIKQGFASIVSHFTTDNEVNVLNSIAQIKSKIEKLSGLHAPLDALSERVRSVLIEVSDIGEDALIQLDNLEVDPHYKEHVSLKLDTYYKALRKHRVTSQTELKAVWKSLLNSENDLNSLEDEIKELKIQIDSCELALSLKADALHILRLSVVGDLDQKLMGLMDVLKLPATKIHFQLSKGEKYSDSGLTKVDLLFSPNKGMEIKPMEKTASGGELSRLMLSIQCVLSEKKQLPTMIFDEIDTGVSGEVAQRIGGVLADMGKKMQVFAITHLPQVAGKGQQHWKVVKHDNNEVAETEVVALNTEQRIEEIARLMSGDNINKAALENAKALMN